MDAQLHTMIQNEYHDQQNHSKGSDFGRDRNVHTVLELLKLRSRKVVALTQAAIAENQGHCTRPRL